MVIINQQIFMIFWDANFQNFFRNILQDEMGKFYFLSLNYNWNKFTVQLIADI